MKNKKSAIIKKIIIVLVVLAVVVDVVLILFSRPAKPLAKNNPLSGLNINGAQAQSYSAPAAPQERDDDKIFGSKKSKLNIFVYEDYTNPFSAVLANTLEKIKADFGDDLAVIVRPYFKDSPAALSAALAVDCADEAGSPRVAGEAGKWEAMRALLFARAKNKQLASADFSDYINQLDLNAEKFNNCLTKNEKSGKIEALASEVETYSIQGAPTMFIGGEMVLGARPYADFVDSNGDKVVGLKNLVAEKLK